MTNSEILHIATQQIREGVDAANAEFERRGIDARAFYPDRIEIEAPTPRTETG